MDGKSQEDSTGRIGGITKTQLRSMALMEILRPASASTIRLLPVKSSPPATTSMMRPRLNAKPAASRPRP